MTTDPQPNELLTDYLDRMLGKPGSPERKTPTFEMYQRYLAIWDQYWREHTAQSEE